MRNCARFASLARILSVSLAFFTGGSIASGQHVLRIEEDWEVVVKNPEMNLVAPQITCAISPRANLDGAHATFEMNHHSSPFFSPGGLRLLAWDGTTQGANASHGSNVIMSRENETVTWTTSMSLADGRLTFEIVNGQSETWNAFGGDGSRLRVSQMTTLLNLNGYDPEVSIANSGVGYASNRVQSMTLKRVRVTMSDGTVVVNDTPRNVEL